MEGQPVLKLTGSRPEKPPLRDGKKLVAVIGRGLAAAYLGFNLMACGGSAAFPSSYPEPPPVATPAQTSPEQNPSSASIIPAEFGPYLGETQNPRLIYLDNPDYRPDDPFRNLKSAEIVLGANNRALYKDRSGKIRVIETDVKSGIDEVDKKGQAFVALLYKSVDDKTMEVVQNSLIKATLKKGMTPEMLQTAQGEKLAGLFEEIYVTMPDGTSMILNEKDIIPLIQDLQHNIQPTRQPNNNNLAINEMINFIQTQFATTALLAKGVQAAGIATATAFPVTVKTETPTATQPPPTATASPTATAEATATRTPTRAPTKEPTATPTRAVEKTAEQEVEDWWKTLKMNANMRAALEPAKPYLVMYLKQDRSQLLPPKIAAKIDEIIRERGSPKWAVDWRNDGYGRGFLQTIGFFESTKTQTAPNYPRKPFLNPNIVLDPTTFNKLGKDAQNIVTILTRADVLIKEGDFGLCFAKIAETLLFDLSTGDGVIALNDYLGSNNRQPLQIGEALTLPRTIEFWTMVRNNVAGFSADPKIQADIITYANRMVDYYSNMVLTENIDFNR